MFNILGDDDLHNGGDESRRHQVAPPARSAHLHRGPGEQPQPPRRLAPLRRRTQD